MTNFCKILLYFSSFISGYEEIKFPLNNKKKIDVLDMENSQVKKMILISK